jgi:hypothetical protein
MTVNSAIRWRSPAAGKIAQRDDGRSGQIAQWSSSAARERSRKRPADPACFPFLHALARSIARGSRLTFNRALVLHSLPWRAILRRALRRAHHCRREQQAASGCNRKNFPHLSSLHWWRVTTR